MTMNQDESETLKQHACGDTGPTLSALGLGCWQLGGGDYWGPSDQAGASRLVHQAVDWGINYFDTAEMYNEGRSETFLGRALKGMARERFVVGTKVWPTHLDPQALRRSCEKSLRRLDLDRIDLYMIHWPLATDTFDRFTDVSRQGVSGQTGRAVTVPSLADAVATLLELQREGKIRWLGLSNYGATRLNHIQQVGGVYVVDQVAYNLVTRAAEYELLPYCQAHHIGVMTYMTLMQGLLTDKYQTLDAMPDWYTRTRHFNCQRNPKTRHGESGAEPELIQALQGIRDLAREYGSSMADLALQWVIANPAVTCALIGTHSLDSLKKNVTAAARPLDPDLVYRLNRITEPLKHRLGPGLDIFENTQCDRT
ncbi:MAG: aldo/keto reductase [Phycisphaerae bacterium]|nr:aldo/keto reductase [Phycisphaerae bacterium]